MGSKVVLWCYALLAEALTPRLFVLPTKRTNAYHFPGPPLYVYHREWDQNLSWNVESLSLVRINTNAFKLHSAGIGLRNFKRLFTWTYVYCHDGFVLVTAGRVVLFLTCYREVRSCYQPLCVCGTGDATVPRNPLLRGLNGDSRLTLLVAVMWYSTRPRRRQSTPSLWSATAGVATEKPCSLAVAEGLPPPLESLHTWKLNLIFARWSSWDLA